MCDLRWSNVLCYPGNLPVVVGVFLVKHAFQGTVVTAGTVLQVCVSQIGKLNCGAGCCNEYMPD